MSIIRLGTKSFFGKHQFTDQMLFYRPVILEEIFYRPGKATQQDTAYSTDHVSFNTISCILLTRCYFTDQMLFYRPDDTLQTRYYFIDQILFYRPNNTLQTRYNFTDQIINNYLRILQIKYILQTR